MVSENVAFQQRKRIGKGINFGNSLEFEEKPWDGGQLITWVIEKADIVRIREIGFDSLRLPVNWAKNSMKDFPYSIEPKFLKRVDQLIEWALYEGLTVVLDDHHHEAMSLNPLDEKNRYLSIWKQIAEHYKSYPENLYWEILNEANKNLNADLWNGISGECLLMLRSIDPHRTLILGPVDYNNWRCLSNLLIPKNMSNLIVSVHYYEPSEFTHQGAYWFPHPIGNVWSGTEAEMTSINVMLDAVKRWETENNCPVYIGEFGVIHLADMQSRERYLQYFCKAMEAKEITWQIWDYCADFKIYDREKGMWTGNLPRVLLA